jgi:hypothetical protein
MNFSTMHPLRENIPAFSTGEYPDRSLRKVLRSMYSDERE